ncbi:hypothetical protein DSM104443_00603 [Usitatibacter rugosus]|uniref:CAAX prenyl protease 2/Lysostaphin resistance protein A-like domain-containing protein n=1 Tax=Usitatibacter rugosus TaxID=2732067 RepID=A0A6M4GSV6_9PROT|nr:CPBP family intramembrane glutamic endopeptidase [Usitatibacter rugosus]QJR09554.1 hypothetical protein DSM104443_00603 [Usitatibacter rugosus]
MTHNLGPASRDFNKGEFLLVILLAFGLALGTSLLSFAADPSAPPTDGLGNFGNVHLWALLGYEVAFAPLIAYVLHHGGWRWPEFHFNYSNRGTVEGLGLAAVTLLFDTAVSLLFTGEVKPGERNADWIPIILVSLLNPLYEELLVCAFVIEAMRKRFGIMTAVNVSIAIRLLYHLYQGPLAFIVFAVMGTAFTIFYVRTGRLWPLVFAHVLLDLLPLSGFP